MSQTEKSSPKLFQALCAVLLVTTVIFGTLAAFFFVSNGALQNDKTSLSNQIAKDNQTIVALNTKIAADKTLIDNYTAWVHTLQTQTLVDKNTITDLQHKIDALKAEIDALPKVDWTTGTVRIDSMTCGTRLFHPTCRPVAIEFTQASNGQTYSSTLKMDTYTLWLLNNTAYSPVTIIYTSTFILTTIKTCTASPSTFIHEPSVQGLLLLRAMTGAESVNPPFSKPPCKVLTEGNAKWFACAVDSEGFLYEQKIVPFRPTIGIVNSNRPFLEKALELIGGGTIYERKHGSSITKKTLYEFRLYGDDKVRSALRQILPYLIVKRERAESLLHSIELRRGWALSPLGESSW